MKIAYLSTFYPFRGGIAQFNASLYRALKQHNEVKAFTFTRQYPSLLFPGETQYVQPGDVADQIDSVACLDSMNPISYQRTANKIKQWAPDVLIMKYWMSFFGPSMGWVARQMPAQTKVITILDNVIPHEPRFFDRPFTRFFLKQNDGFVAMSKKVANDLQSMRSDARFIEHMHPIYDHFGEQVEKVEARKALNLPADKKILLFFGFIRDYKGLDILLESFSRLGDDYQLVIAGEVYGQFDKYQQQIDDLPNKRNVHLFVEYISDDRVPLFFSAADVCVLPYKSATQSGITYISYHFNVPLIATDVGGLRETIEHGKTGLIVSEPEPSMLQESIEQFFVIDSQESYKNEIARLKAELSWDHLAAELIAFAQQL